MHLLVKCLLFIVSLIFSPSIICCVLSFVIWARQWQLMKGNCVWVEGHTGSLAWSRWHSDGEEQLAANYSHVRSEQSPRQGAEALRGRHLSEVWRKRPIRPEKSMWAFHAVRMNKCMKLGRENKCDLSWGHQISCGACRVVWGPLSQVVSMWTLC